MHPLHIMTQSDKIWKRKYTDILRVDKWEYDTLAGSASELCRKI